jgi:hypothetical protein
MAQDVLGLGVELDGLAIDAMPLTEKQIADLVAKWEPLLSKPKPKPVPELRARVSEKLADAARANPGSVRVIAEGGDGVTVIDRPRRSDIVEVLEVDGDGRPLRRQSPSCGRLALRH